MIIASARSVGFLQWLRDQFRYEGLDLLSEHNDAVRFNLWIFSHVLGISSNELEKHWSPDVILLIPTFGHLPCMCSP